MKKFAFIYFSFLSFNLIAQNDLSTIDTLFQNAFDRHEFTGNVLIAKEGRVLYEKSFGFADDAKKRPLSKNSQFQIASVSKQFTAFGIVVLKK